MILEKKNYVCYKRQYFWTDRGDRITEMKRYKIIASDCSLCSREEHILNLFVDLVNLGLKLKRCPWKAEEMEK
jgi:hypothetical protein